LLGIVATAVALKIAVVVPAVTVTDAGRVSKVLLLVSPTADPPAGAVWVRVTVQVLTPLGPRVAGLHARLDTITGAGAIKLIAAGCELLPRVAVTVAP
jgi:hypothetical protein